MNVKCPRNFPALSMILAALFLSVQGLHATDAPEVEAETDEATKLAKQLANPISSLISVPFQANEDFGYGPSHNGYKFTLNIQPVISTFGAFLFFRDRLAPRFFLYAAIAILAGVFLSIERPDLIGVSFQQAGLSLGTGYALICAFFWAGSTVAGRGVMLGMPLRLAASMRIVVGLVCMTLILLAHGKLHGAALWPVAAQSHTAKAIGLDALAITDHDTIQGAKEFQQRVQRQSLPVQIIVGEEKTLSDGSHLIGLFLEKHIESGELSSAIAEIQAQGGFCLVPHPFRKSDGLLRTGLEGLPLFEGGTAGFELFSAKCSYAENRRARELLSTSLSPFGGSDAHYDCDLGESLNVITWQGDLKTSLLRMFQRKAPFQILGKPQTEGAAERAYAPLYYRCKKFVRMPRPLVPLAKQCYRWYRNKKYGIGRKPLVEVYAHP